MASDQRADLLYPGGGPNNQDVMSASTSSTISAFATGEHNVGASSTQVNLCP